MKISYMISKVQNLCTTAIATECKRPKREISISSDIIEQIRWQTFSPVEGMEKRVEESPPLGGSLRFWPLRTLGANQETHVRDRRKSHAFKSKWREITETVRKKREGKVREAYLIEKWYSDGSSISSGFI